MILAGIGVTGMVCQWVAWRVRLPAILFLLLAGLAAGPLTGVLDPDVLFGDLLFPFISLSVAVILFEGSLTLEFREIAGLEKVIRRLVSSGMIITWTVTAMATHWIMDFPWELAFLFGAITVVTGPTVIAPLLRTVRPVAPVAKALRWEGIVIDPIGALLAVLAYEFIISLTGSIGWGHALLVFGQTVLTGTVAGVAGGYVTSIAIKRNWLADNMINVAVLTTVFAVFALSNAVQHESGLLAVTIMGMWMANAKGLDIEDILEFKETLTLMLLSVLFIVLAARMDFFSLQQLGLKALAVVGVMLVIARPLKVMYSSWGSSMSWRERVLLAWIAPRGIVAAAVSALFALRLEKLGLPHADQLLPLTFTVVVGTVILQSATARPIARALGVTEPDPVGFLIVGANPVARAVGLALHQQGVSVRLCDSDWDSIAKARMDGLPTYYGSPVSEHARRNLDLTGLGRMLALGAADTFNELVTTTYRDEFGRANIFALPEVRKNDPADKHSLVPTRRGRRLFSESMTYWEMADYLWHGGTIHGTMLSKDFNFEQYRQHYDGKLVPLFAINPDGYAHPFTIDNNLSPAAGWTVLSLFPAEEHTS